jgi:hypothetical protein
MWAVERKTISPYKINILTPILKAARMEILRTVVVLHA